MGTPCEECLFSAMSFSVECNLKSRIFIFLLIVCSSIFDYLL